MKKWIRRGLAGAAGLALAFGAAAAEEKTADSWYYGGTGQDVAYTATPLPDGRLLLNGYTQGGRAGVGSVIDPRYHATRAWLLCLDTDGSVAWETIDDAEGTTRYICPNLQPDGRVGVLYLNAPEQELSYAGLRWFSTEDGRLLTDLEAPEAGDYLGAAGAGWIGGGWGGETVYFDGEQTLPFSPDTAEPVYCGMPNSYIPLADGFVGTGQVRGAGRRPAIVRCRLDGSEVWRWTSPDVESGHFSWPVRDRDGGYVFIGTAQDPENWTPQGCWLYRVNEEGTLISQAKLPLVFANSEAPAVTGSGYVLSAVYERKNRTCFDFAEVDAEGVVQRAWKAEPRSEFSYSGSLVSWQGEAWFLTTVERPDTRVTEEQEDLELADVLLIRVSACEETDMSRIGK